MEHQYYIDFTWYEENNRSFAVLARSRLCPACRDKLKRSKRSEEALLLTIKDCCSQIPGFITPKLPILETVFRIFLANGNELLTLEEIRQKLEEYRGEGFGLTPEALSRLLDNESYYGFRQIPGEPEEPEELEKAEEPEKMEEPEEAGEPEEPAEPEKPEKPKKRGKPKRTAKPEETGEPEEPEVPSP